MSDTDELPVGVMTLAPSATQRPADGAPPILELESVTKSYGGEPPVTALAGVSLAVTEGELLAILGPSGSGKSTLLHLIGTLDRPSTGSIRVTGIDVSQLSDRQLAAVRANRIGFVFQQFFLSEHATAVENVADGLLYTGFPPRERQPRGPRGARAGRARAPHRRAADPAVGWRTPAGRDRPRARRAPRDRPRRRADREPRQRHRGRDPLPP